MYYIIVLIFNFLFMKQEIIDHEEDRLLDEWDREFERWIRNGPAYRAYNTYIIKKKEQKMASIIA